MIAGPETIWVVGLKSAMEQNQWIKAFSKVMEVKEEDISEGVRKGEYSFKKKRGFHYLVSIVNF